MADLTEFHQAAAQLPRGGIRGWWNTIGLTGQQAEQLREALLHPHITDRAVQQVLASWGHNIGIASIGTYRRKLGG